MSETRKSSRPLRAFLCHSSRDKERVRGLYQRLCAEGIEPWFDEEALLPGQDWDREVLKAMREVDVVIVCLSRESINKKGYVQKEIKYALDVADEQPEDAIFLIPLKLEPCKIPHRLSRWHCVDVFAERGFERLMSSLRRRTLEAKGLGDVPQFLSLNLDSILLENVEALIRLLRASSEETYWVMLDKDRNVISASDSFGELLRLPKDSILGKDIGDLVVPEQVEPMQQRFVHRTGDKKAIMYFTEFQNLPNKNVIVYAFPILDSGEYAGSIGILVPMNKINTLTTARVRHS